MDGNGIGRSTLPISDNNQGSEVQERSTEPEIRIRRGSSGSSSENIVRRTETGLKDWEDDKEYFH